MAEGIRFGLASEPDNFRLVNQSLPSTVNWSILAFPRADSRGGRLSLQTK
jgi:hypothetical protein